MEINNPEQAQFALDRWRGQPEPAQRRQLEQAVKSLEMGQLYYESKGREDSVARLEECIFLLRNRLKELKC